MRTNTFPTALLISSALTAAVAGAAYASGGGERHADAREIAALTPAPVTLRQAIGTAETESRGRALEAEAEREDGRLVYEVTTLVDGKLHELTIDAQSGAVLEREVEAAEDDELPAGKIVDIATAMAAAEAAGNGQAIEAEFETEDGRALYEVEVMSGQSITTILVDAKSGQVLALEDGRHDDRYDGDRNDDD